MKYNTKQKQDAFDRMAAAIGWYIKTLGGSAIVVGPSSVETDLGVKYRYFFRVQVTGKPPRPEKPTPSRKGKKITKR